VRTEPASAQEVADRLRSKQEAIKKRKQGRKFAPIAALADADGTISHDPIRVTEIAKEYGVSQNRESNSDDEALKLWLTAFVPKGAPLTMPNGAAWRLRSAITPAVFRRETLMQKRDKANGLHPFLIDMIQMLPEDHPTIEIFYELMMRCMEDGVYPQHYLEIAAVLIPKKMDGILQMMTLRDIWLINHGAKLAERCILRLATVPVGRRLLLCHSGGCRGRGCTEQAWALHVLIADAICRRRPMYTLYVDLTKCFMSFSRTAAKEVFEHKGVPPEALKALAGLVNNWKHGVAQGKYETAFGATPLFGLLRGFLQGAQGSPEACREMMDTLAQALELKVQGYRGFAPDGAGDSVVQLVFVDDAANVTGDIPMVRRVALFWTIWCHITDCKANIKGKAKTVLTGIEFVQRKDGSKRPVSVTAHVYLGGLEQGDAPRRIPILKINENYTYVGQPTRMDGKHNEEGMALIKKQLNMGATMVGGGSTSRRLAVSTMQGYTYGSCFFYGTCFGGSLETVEAALGPASRKAILGNGVKGARRCRTAPRVQLHANAGGIKEAANDDLSAHIMERAGEAAYVTGYGVPHPWPAMMAAGLATLANGLASPQRTPATIAAHLGVARVLWLFGIREKPCEADMSALVHELDLNCPIERPLWLLLQLNHGQMSIRDIHFEAWSPLREERWPGYPALWIGLWRGAMADRLRLRGLRFCRALARAGIAELANLCHPVELRLLTFEELSQRNPRAIEHGVRPARKEHEALLAALAAINAEAVPGRGGWSLIDAAEGWSPAYVPKDFGSHQRQCAREAESAIRSGDGGHQLAAHLGVDIEPPLDKAHADDNEGELSSAEEKNSANGEDKATVREARDNASNQPVRRKRSGATQPEPGPTAKRTSLRARVAHWLPVPVFIKFAVNDERGEALLMAYTLTPFLVYCMLQEYPELEEVIRAQTQSSAVHSCFWTTSERARHAVTMGSALDLTGENARSIEEAKVLGLQWDVWERHRRDQPANQEPAERRPQQALIQMEPVGVSPQRPAKMRTRAAAAARPRPPNTAQVAPAQARTAPPVPSAADEDEHDELLELIRRNRCARDATRADEARCEEDLRARMDIGINLEKARQFLEAIAGKKETTTVDGDELPGAQPTVTGARRLEAWQLEEELPIDPSAPPLSCAQLRREALTPPLETDETCRVIRATDPFGVLAIALHPDRPPHDQEVHRAFVAVRDRLEREQGRWDRGPTVRHPRRAAARRAVQAAWHATRGRASRLILWGRWTASMRGPITTTLQSLVDTAALEKVANSTDAAQPGKYPGRTVGGEIAELLARAAPDGENAATARVEAHYRHSRRGARIVAAGFVRYSREFVDGPDPFQSARLVRTAAWEDISYEGDDQACYPTAQLALFGQAGAQMTTFVTYPKAVRRAVGDHLIRHDKMDSEERLAHAKTLLNALDNGGSVTTWAVKLGDAYRTGAVADTNLQLDLPEQRTFNVARFAAEADAGATWLERRRPALVEFVTNTNRHMGDGARRHVLTAKSFVLQDYEGASRAAKTEWARVTGGEIISLQHDGVRIRLGARWRAESAARALTETCSAVLGYRQTVAVKSLATAEETGRRTTKPQRIPAPVVQVEQPLLSRGANPRNGDARAALELAMAAMAGTSTPAACVDQHLAGADQLDLDGRRRRAVYSYDGQPEPEQRVWRTRVQGGHHVEWRGRGQEWLEKVTKEYKIDADGAVQGNPLAQHVPLAARFWWECQKLCKEKKANAKECRFVFAQLLRIEAEYPVTHFVASDGSKGRTGPDEQMRIGRACIVLDKLNAKATEIGGELDIQFDNFERHSYEAELAAFHDHLAATADTVTVFITDCLSGAQAGQAYEARTDAGMRACYRSKELDNLDRLEQRHRAVIYVHVRSHKGIIPNEAADVIADKMREGGAKSYLHLDIMPSRHALCTFKGVKRSIGRAGLDWCNAAVVNHLLGAVVYTLLPNKFTWEPFRNSPVKGRVMTEATYDALADCRANRGGLNGDRREDDPDKPPPPVDKDQAWARMERRSRRGSFDRWAQNHAPCPGCSGFECGECTVEGLWNMNCPAQTRWHVLTECADVRLTELRLKAAEWLSNKLEQFGREAQWALAALSGAGDQLRPDQRMAALRFMLGLPNGVAPECRDGESKLAKGYGKGFLKWIGEIIRTAGRTAQTARSGPDRPTVQVRWLQTEGRAKWTSTRTKWMATRGWREVHEGAGQVRTCFRALRTWAAAAGPNALRQHKQARQVQKGGAGSFFTPTPDETRCGNAAYDEWSTLITQRAVAPCFAKWVALVTQPANAAAPPNPGGQGSAADREAERRARARRVWLRHAGYDPDLTRRVDEAAKTESDAKEQVRADRRDACNRKRDARAAGKRNRAEARTARNDDKATQAKVADAANAAQSAAVGRSKRASHATTNAAIHAAKKVSQRPETQDGETRPTASADPLTRRCERPKCTMGHFLQRSSGADTADSIRCNGPCQRVIPRGEERISCCGTECDVDICIPCTGEGTRERDGFPPPTCTAGHTLTFARRGPPSGDGLKCDGECGRRIHEGVWRYSCETCDADWCASCERTSHEERATKRARRGGERTPPAQFGKEVPKRGQTGEPAMVRARRAVRSTESARPSAGTDDARGPSKRGPPTAEPPEPALDQRGSRQRV